VSDDRGRRLFPVLLGLWAAVFLARAAIGVSYGVRAEYFIGTEPRGVPFVTRVDPDVSTASVRAAWTGDLPSAFSVRWFGYLTVYRSGEYTLGTRSDDGSRLTIDGRLVVDNGGEHPATTRTASIGLEAGQHALYIEYVQAVADYEMSLLWGPDAGHLSAVPAWRLSPNRVGPSRLLLARVLDWASIAALTLLMLVGVPLAVVRFRLPVPAAARAHPRAAALLFFVAMTVVQTWPLATHPARLSRNNTADTLLNEWALSWIAHQLPRAPLRLYDANAFYPERGTLAYSEPMIVQGLLAAPLRWLGASPVLAYNLVLLAGFALSGWTMSMVIARWTRSWSAGLVSGVLFGFNAHTLTRMPHMHAQHVEFLPLALLALDALLRTPTFGSAGRLALWFTLQALTSLHLLIFTAVSMIASALVRPAEWIGRNFVRVAGCAALAAAMASIVLLPFLLPYWYAYQHQGLARPISNAAAFSATWRDYLSTPARIHYDWWGYRVFTGTGLFPGAIGVALTAFAVARGTAFKDSRARMCLALGVAGVLLSFGTHVPGYAALYQLFAPLRAIRAVVRFGYLGIVGVAAVAGFGVVELKRVVPDRYWPPLAQLLVALVAIEAFRGPIGYSRYDGISPIYRQIRHEPDAVVVELPFYSGPAAFLHAKYMLNSTEHWRPMLNGYSGFLPFSYQRNYEALEGFPDARSIAWLRALGVTHVFLHVDEMGPQAAVLADRAPGFRRIAAEGPIVLYRVSGAQ
jgi:hypothetical protein